VRRQSSSELTTFATQLYRWGKRCLLRNHHVRDRGDDSAGTDQMVNLGHSIQSCIRVVWHTVEEESRSAPL